MDLTSLNKSTFSLNRRTLLTSAAAAGVGLAVPHIWTGRASAANPIEIVHWSWLAASDGEVWAKMIAAFNDAHKDKGVQIRMEVVPEEQYVTKVLAASATGKAPDFGWGTAGKSAQLARDEVIIPLTISSPVGRHRRFQRGVDRRLALSEIRQQGFHDPHGPDEPAT